MPLVHTCHLFGKAHTSRLPSLRCWLLAAGAIPHGSLTTAKRAASVGSSGGCGRCLGTLMLLLQLYQLPQLAVIPQLHNKLLQLHCIGCLLQLLHQLPIRLKAAQAAGACHVTRAPNIGRDRAQAHVL